MDPNTQQNNGDDAATQKTLTLPKKEITDDFAADAEALKKSVLGGQPELNTAAPAAEPERVFKEKTIEAGQMVIGLIPMGLYVAKLPTAAKVWNPVACREVAAAALPVLDEFSWGKACIKFIEESGSAKMIQLAAVLQPLAFATFEGVMIDLANKKNEKANEVKSPGEVNVTAN